MHVPIRPALASDALEPGPYRPIYAGISVSLNVLAP